MKIKGVVSSGLGRAHLFMAQSHYQEQFQKVIGSTAWPGTLNVAVSGDDFIQYASLREVSGVETAGLDSLQLERIKSVNVESLEPYRINGFLRDGVSFGGATAFIATIFSGEKQEECAVLIPDLTRHTDVLEVISRQFLREKLGISDGDEIIIEL